MLLKLALPIDRKSNPKGKLCVFRGRILDIRVFLADELYRLIDEHYTRHMIDLNQTLRDG